MADDPGGSDSGDALEGRYANFFQVGHNAYEFVLEFGQANPPDPARCHTRVITSPAYAKAFLMIMRKSIDQYEKDFGAIPEGTDQDN
jgi:uncharacterized protein DUF3467